MLSERRQARKERIRERRQWDNVYVQAVQEYDCAWKCLKCGKLHEDHGKLKLSELLHNTT